jgi:hypothetical protein
MNKMNKETFQKLSETHQPHCVSIFIPTHRAPEGGEAYKKDQLHLKNQLKEAEKQLKLFENSESEIETYLQPIRNLLDDTTFWQHLSDGLAIFYDGKEVKHFTVPEKFEEFTYVNNHFYLKPLVNLINDDQRYNLLTLHLNQVRLFEVSRQDLYEVAIADKAPTKMTDTVGEDYEPKHLQFRTGQGEVAGSDGIFHGHGESNQTVKKEEALRFFQQLSNGLEELLNKKKLPLVVACVDYLFPLFKDATDYNHLVDEHISGNVEHMDLNELQNRAWEIMNPHLNGKQKEYRENFEGNLSNRRAAYDLEDVIPASVSGRTEALFIKKDAEVWGKYIEEKHKVEIHEVRNVRDAGLLNMAAIRTINQGGRVYLVGEDEMPEDTSPANAVFRYEMN